MKIKNNADGIRALRDNGKFIEVGPGEIIEVDRPVFNEKVFEIINDQKSNEKKTLGLVEKDKLKKETK